MAIDLRETVLEYFASHLFEIEVDNAFEIKIGSDEINMVVPSGKKWTGVVRIEIIESDV